MSASSREKPYISLKTNSSGQKVLISKYDSKEISVSSITNAELECLSGATYPIQTQIDLIQSTIGLGENSSGTSLTNIIDLLQTQLNEKQSTITGAALTILNSDLIADRALLSDGSGKVAVSSVTSTELGYLSGVKGLIQTQIDNTSNFATSQIATKQNIITGGATTITSTNLTTDRALLSDSSGKVGVSSVTSTELGYLTGVTNSIQTQFNDTLNYINNLNSKEIGENSNIPFSPEVWYKFTEDPINNNILKDYNLSQEVNFDMNIYNTFMSSNNSNISSIYVDNVYKQPVLITDNQYYYSFTETSKINKLLLYKDLLCDILLIGGGGSGGIKAGGGGGAGEFKYLQNIILPKGEYLINIGKGGDGGINITGNGQNGNDTLLTSNNAILYKVLGGGGGGGFGNNGLYGGSTGGCGSGQTSSPNTSNGFQGGSGSDSSITYENKYGYAGGGGGGSSTLGGNASRTVPTTMGNGGDGIICDITGIDTIYAAGGGGGINHYLESYKLDNGGGKYINNIYQRVGG